jgi:D-alanyl-D-alanine carboxypeptidase (penicillin-binding protein 5/6)
MNFDRKTGWLCAGLLFIAACVAEALDVRSRDPYYGAIVVEAGSGRTLWEDHAGAEAYPASMIKMMNVFVVLDAVQAGTLRLDQPVEVTREIADIGGRQVWLKQGEVFPLEELIYATMIHSANDAATAIALVCSGSREAHAAKMNAKAQALGMTRTSFHNVHGLPPGAGQQVDVSCARDMARLADALMTEHPDVLTYSSVSTRPFRDSNSVMLTSSNKLLGRVDGCDGLKTGYFQAGGFSITATAQRNGTRIIAVVMGCKDKAARDLWAAKLVEQGFAGAAAPAPGDGSF